VSRLLNLVVRIASKVATAVLVGSTIALLFWLDKVRFVL
jgi:hypothetical protein